MTGKDYANLAREYLNAPFVFGGRDKTAGIDCIGLLIVIGRRTGQCPENFDLPPYTNPPDPGLFDHYLPLFMDEVPADQVTVGDAIVLRAPVGGKRRRDGELGQPTHVGIVGDYASAPGILSLIYVNEAQNLPRVTESRLDKETQSRIYKVFRFRNRTDL